MAAFSPDAVLIASVIGLHALVTVVAMIVTGRGLSAISWPLNRILKVISSGPPVVLPPTWEPSNDAKKRSPSDRPPFSSEPITTQATEICRDNGPSTSPEVPVDRRG